MSNQLRRKLPDILPRPSDTETAVQRVLQIHEQPEQKHPKPQQSLPPSSEDGGRDRKAKRISVACIACQKRKTKCDGSNPCSACTDRSTECEFNPYSDRRRKDHYAKDSDVLNNRRDKIGDIMKASRVCSEQTFQEALQMVHSKAPLSQIAEFLHSNLPSGSTEGWDSVFTQFAVKELETASDGSSFRRERDSASMSSCGTSARSFDQQRLERRLSSSILDTYTDSPHPSAILRMERSSVDLQSQASISPFGSGRLEQSPLDGSFLEHLISRRGKQAGPLTAFPVWQHTIGPDSVKISTTPSIEQPWDPSPSESALAQTLKSWTSASSDHKCIDHLFSLYKTVWGISVYFFIDFKLFLRDMVPCVTLTGEINGGSGKYFFACDLANSLLALSCFFCKEPFAFGDICEPSTRGEHFLQEAIMQMKAYNQDPCLTRAQAFACLALADSCRGRLGSARRLWLCCVDTFIALLKNPRPAPSRRSAGEMNTKRRCTGHEPDRTYQEGAYSRLPSNFQTEMDFQIKRSVLALGMFCVESILLTEVNSPRRTAPPLRAGQATGMEQYQFQQDLIAMPHLASAVRTHPRAPGAHMGDDDQRLLNLLYSLKAEMADHPPPGFLSTDYQNSEEILGLGTSEGVTLAFPQLRTIYIQFTTLWEKFNSSIPSVD